MPLVFNRLALVLSIAVAATASHAAAADKESPKFSAAPAPSYAAHQTSSKVTIGVDPFVDGEKARPAFGKNNPYQYGVLPVLVVIQNDTEKALRVDRLKVDYIGPNRNRVEATPAAEIKFLTGPRRPDVMAGPTGVPKIRKHKNPLDSWEIEGRAFAARMIPAGQSASGFFYFQTGFQRGSRLYITGMAEADTGKEILYFEVSME